jgi:hypothetical protein
MRVWMIETTPKTPSTPNIKYQTTPLTSKHKLSSSSVNIKFIRKEVKKARRLKRARLHFPQEETQLKNSIKEVTEIMPDILQYLDENSLLPDFANILHS